MATHSAFVKVCIPVSFQCRGSVLHFSRSFHLPAYQTHGCSIWLANASCVSFKASTCVQHASHVQWIACSAHSMHRMFSGLHVHPAVHTHRPGL
eukprot:1139763-Pelagomonas_calceolata.AAC.6